MRCSRAERALVFSFYGDLEPRERRSLEHHLLRCDSCSRKAAEIRRVLESMPRAGGDRPAFDWEASWRVISAGLGRPAGGPGPAAVRVRRLLPAAALGLVLAVLGAVVIGRFLPAPSSSPGKEGLSAATASPLALDHLESVGLTLREFMNRDFSADSRAVLEFEKERARSLLLRNRAVRASLSRTAGDSSLLPVLDELEIVLYEASNFEPSSPGSLENLRGLIHEQRILAW